MAPYLDSSKNNCNTSCGQLVAVGMVQVDGKWFRSYSRIYCKRWSCPFCGPYRAAQFAKDVERVAKEHGLSRFLTLTLDPKKIKPDQDPIKLLRGSWRKFRVYLARKYKTTVSFISVVELHQSGIPHMHVLVDRFIKQSWISANWSKLGGGRIVDIRFVRDLDKMGWYLGKYLSKEGIMNLPKGVRRYSTSQDIKLRKKADTSGWELLKTDLDTVYTVAKGNATDQVRLLSGELRSFNVPLPVDVGDDDLGISFPESYEILEEEWRRYIPGKDELPAELKNTRLGFEVVAVSDLDQDNEGAAS